MTGRRTAAVLAGVTLAVSGCRLDVVAEAAFDVTGGGELLVAVRIDGATLRELDALGVDPGLVAAAELDPALGWRTSREVDADGGLLLAHRLAFDDGPELAAALRALDDGLAADDPALRIDLDVTTALGGAVELDGTAGLSPPGTVGRVEDGVPVGPSVAELAALTQEAVRPVLRVRVPGAVLAHDGDRVDGRTVTWALPVGGVRPVSLTSSPAAWWRGLPWAAVVAAAVGAGIWWSRRRRGAAAEHGAAAGDPDAGVSPAG